MSVSLLSLWLPVLLSAAAVYIASSVIHMVLQWHRNDLRAVPDEAGVADALRPFAIPPGDYVIPHAADAKEMKSPDFAARSEAGPVAIFTVFPNRLFAMGGSLVQWFGYCLAVSGIAGFAAGVGLGPGTEFWTVFRAVSVTAFAGYAMGVFQSSIWWGRSWGFALRTAADGLIYAWITAAIFSWLWP